MSLIRQILRTETRDAAGSSLIPPYAGSGATNAAGVVVTPETSLRHGAVFACVRLLGDTMGGLPIKVGGVQQQPDLLRNGDPEWPWFDTMFAASVSLDLRGNAYFLILERDNKGLPTSFMLLNPDAVMPFRPANGDDRGVLQYRLGSKLLVPASEIIHVRLFIMPGRDLGLSVIEHAAVTIGLGIAAEIFGATWFRDGANPSAILTTAQQLDPKATAALQSNWQEIQGGKRRTAVLTHGLSWTPIQIAPNESQFIQTLQANTTSIARWFGIPPHKIGDLDRATFSNIEQQQIEFKQDAVLPRAIRFEYAFERALRLDHGQLQFDLEHITRGDLKSRYEALEIKRRNGVINADEWRAEDGDGPLPNGIGKVYLQPLNMAEVGKGDDPVSLFRRSQAALALVTAGWNADDVTKTLGLPDMAYIGPPPKTALTQSAVDNTPQGGDA